MPLPETSELNVVIVDDHVALRRGMELLLRRAGHHVVGTADDAEAGEALIIRRKPDVALVDLALPGSSSTRAPPTSGSCSTPWTPGLRGSL